MTMHNFCSGPAILPKIVIEEAQQALVNFKNTGLSILEMSHRSKEILEMIAQAKSHVFQISGLSENDYEVMFLHGGASLQFSMIPMNLLMDNEIASYINTGLWTEKAIQEAKLFGNVHIAGSSKTDNFNYIPTDIKIHEKSEYVYIASNNTVYGTQWKNFPDTGNIPLIADMSSDIFSRNIDYSKFKLIYAGAQKNIGAAGVCLVIMHKSLIKNKQRNVPSMLNYAVHSKSLSVFNTPPVFSIYTCLLTLQWLQSSGGLPYFDTYNTAKAKLFYDCLDKSEIFEGTCNIADRSIMNATFRFKKAHEHLQDAFVQLCKENNIVQIKGHSTVGGYRASMYNALRKESVQVLCDVMNHIAEKA